MSMDRLTECLFLLVEFLVFDEELFEEEWLVRFLLLLVVQFQPGGGERDLRLSPLFPNGSAPNCCRD